jgi:hypothetical protein
VVAAAAAAIVAIPSVREPVLRAAGWALVVNEPVAPADLIIVSLDSAGAGALQAADLVQSGIAMRVAVFTDPPSGEDHEDGALRGGAWIGIGCFQWRRRAARRAPLKKVLMHVIVMWSAYFGPRSQYAPIVVKALFDSCWRCRQSREPERIWTCGNYVKPNAEFDWGYGTSMAVDTAIRDHARRRVLASRAGGCGRSGGSV